MKFLDKIVILNLALVFTHQVDAAYWHEWEMFALPGGIQLFNALNVLIFLLLLGWLAPVIQRRASGFRCSLAIAAICGSVLPIHAGFALAGYPQFDLPFSIFLIAATFSVSIAQTVMTLRARHAFDSA
jgi:Kef-type K+ transport system membrane component KefB